MAQNGLPRLCSRASVLQSIITDPVLLGRIGSCPGAAEIPIAPRMKDESGPPRPACPGSACPASLVPPPCPAPPTPLLSLYSSSNRLCAFPTGESLLESCPHGSLPVFPQGLLKASLPYRPSGSSCQNPLTHPVFPLRLSLCLQLFF